MKGLPRRPRHLTSSPVQYIYDGSVLRIEFRQREGNHPREQLGGQVLCFDISVFRRSHHVFNVRAPSCFSLDKLFGITHRGR
jgi:hypothetical protein